MVPFAGWEMPVQYADMGVLQSHHHVRESAGLFDVSHMLQTKITGSDHLAFLSRVLVADLSSVPSDRAQLSLITNDRGGIIDDCVVQRRDDHVYLVSNAGTRDKDLAHLHTQLEIFRKEGGDVALEVMEGESLLALQGPKSAQALATLITAPSSPDFLASIPFMAAADVDVAGVPVRLTRCGYTGEDGFEISLPHSEAPRIAELLLSSLGGSVVKLAGLGPRDSLRLEAGLCLYGHDVDEDVSPVEAGLAWTISKKRRAEGGFLGAETILDQIKSGPTRKRVGLIVDGAPAREGAQILSLSGEKLGKVTSGAPSPSLKKNVAMGYVPAGQSKLGTELQVEVRGKKYNAKVVKMPFVPARYYKPN
ncbi:putative aminomethyl transferase [Gonapodya prolifera JEL478]|uniref:Aminomethyltransferase n=1 Tax=Gonapodya prolifera (strain JEL478) TaxID=1344416 RepID=A0A139AIY7_GONPJ|nr:putative aminomethyl transferase [Gonapodya prolifera JEL478]|eukprot:KXS16750.1 putative aminomethyl transferase [Gonapodya prolifera JEL478]